MQSQRFSLGIAGLVAACFFSFSAHANSAGITGQSGKGTNCMQCHGANASALVPTVELTGPTSLVAGATGTYVLVIKGGPAVRGGFNVATDSGTLTAGGADQKIDKGEVTHNGPKNFSNNEVSFSFSLTAPATAGTVKLYASGNSTNGDGSQNGDNAVSKVLDIQVTASTNPGDGDGEEEEEGGCSATGGAPMVMLLALVAARLRRRRD